VRRCRVRWLGGDRLLDAPAAYLVAQAGLRTMLFATAVCTLAQLVPLGRLSAAPPQSPGDDVEVRRRPDIRQMRPLLAFTAMFICVYVGGPVKYAYLPIYMNRQLDFAPALSGAIIGIQPLVELALMPVVVVVARRTGMIRSEQDDVLLAGQEVELSEMQDRGLLDRALEGEVELLQRLARWEARRLDATLAAVGVAAVGLGLQQRGREVLVAALLGPRAVGELGQRARRGWRLQCPEQVRELARGAHAISAS
jgi:hypothetical protein